MKIKDYMFEDFFTIGQDQTLADAVKTMVEKKSNSLIVVEDNKPIGLISAHCIIKEIVPAYLKEDIKSSVYGAEGTFDKYAHESKNRKIKDIMYTDFHTLTDDDSMIEAATFSLKGARRIFPVVSKETEELVGVVTRTSIKNALYKVFFEYKEN